MLAARALDYDSQSTGSQPARGCTAALTPYLHPQVTVLLLAVTIWQVPNPPPPPHPRRETHTPLKADLPGAGTCDIRKLSVSFKFTFSFAFTFLDFLSIKQPMWRCPRRCVFEAPRRGLVLQHMSGYHIYRMTYLVWCTYLVAWLAAVETMPAYLVTVPSPPTPSLWVLPPLWG